MARKGEKEWTESDAGEVIALTRAGLRSEYIYSTEETPRLPCLIEHRNGRFAPIQRPLRQIREQSAIPLSISVIYVRDFGNCVSGSAALVNFKILRHQSIAALCISRAILAYAGLAQEARQDP